jgi:O-antigen/teichoic acid export membrane protein
VILSPIISRNWLKAESLSLGTIHQAIMLMGITVAFQFPIGFYYGGLLGLQRQVLYNWLNGGISALRFAGVIFILWLVSPTILAFFTWQAFISALNSLIAAVTVWRVMPTSNKPAQFQISLLRSVWRFAAGMTGISVTALILTQFDKVILSKLVTLKMFGYYTLASVAAYSINYLLNPIFTALFPRFSQLVALGDQDKIRELYHKSCQLVSVVILPVAAMIGFFSPEVLLLWRQDGVTIEKTHLLLSLLMIGWTLNALVNIPYAIQLAYGWTRLTFYTNLFSIILLIPLAIFLTKKFGAIGASVVWVILNSIYVLIQLPIMHRRLLVGEQKRWYLEDVGKPLVIILIISGI